MKEILNNSPKKDEDAFDIREELKSQLLSLPEGVDLKEFSRYRANPHFYALNREKYLEEYRQVVEAATQGDNFANGQNQIVDWIYRTPGEHGKVIGEKASQKEYFLIPFGHILYHLDFPQTQYDMRPDEDNYKLVNSVKIHAVSDILCYKEIGEKEQEIFLKMLSFTISNILKSYYQTSDLDEILDKSKNYQKPSDIPEKNDQKSFEKFEEEVFLSSWDYPKNIARRLLEKIPGFNPQTEIPGFPRDVPSIEKKWFEYTMDKKDYENWFDILKSEFYMLVMCVELIIETLDPKISEKYKRLIRLKMSPVHEYYKTNGLDFNGFESKHYVEVLRSSFNGTGDHEDNYSLETQKNIVNKATNSGQENLIQYAELCNFCTTLNKNTEDPNTPNLIDGKFTSFTPSDVEKQKMLELTKSCVDSFFQSKQK